VVGSENLVGNVQLPLHDDVAEPTSGRDLMLFGGHELVSFLYQNDVTLQLSAARFGP
jgi:hypothetical protein